MENSLSNEPFGFVFSGYGIKNTCMLVTDLSVCTQTVTSTDQSFLGVASCPFGGWGAQSRAYCHLCFCSVRHPSFYGIWSNESADIASD